jgi:hypothetical protein
MGNVLLIMEKENVIVRKTFSFALRIIRLYEFLRIKKSEFVLSKQIRKAGPVLGRTLKRHKVANPNLILFPKARLH